MRLARGIDARLRAGLIGCAALLVVIPAWELSTPADVKRNAPVQPEMEQGQAAEPAALPGASQSGDYDVIWRRSLFTPERRFYETEFSGVPAGPENDAGAPADGELTLSAVIITEELRMALIESGRDRSIQRIAVGEAVDGWVLSEVTPISALLQRGDDVRRLEIKTVPSSRTTSKPARASPPAERSEIERKTRPEETGADEAAGARPDKAEK